MLEKIVFYLEMVRDIYLLHREFRKPKHLIDQEKINILICGSKEKYEEFKVQSLIK